MTSRGRPVREVTLAHPLFGEVVRAGMPRTRLDQVRLRLADAFEGTAGITDPAARFRVALWRADAGDRTHPAELRAAAWRARSLEAGYVLSEALTDQSKPRDALEAWRAVEELTQAVTQGDLSPTYVLGLGVEAVISVAVGWAALGERRSPRQAVGIGLIVLGLVAFPRTVTRRQRTRMGRTWMALPP